MTTTPSATIPGGRAAIVAVGERNPAFEAVVSLIAEEFSRAIGAPDAARVDWWTSHDDNPMGAEQSVRDLVNAEVMVFDLDHHPLVAGYVLGARLALTEKHTFGVRRAGGGPAPWPRDLEPIEIDPDDDPVNARTMVRERLRAEGRAPLATFQNGFRTSSVVDVRMKRRVCHPNGEPITRLNRNITPARVFETWMPPGTSSIKVQLTFGGIEVVSGFDCWANSENVDMQMARIVDKSVSARIRQLGSVWYGERPYVRGEDAMFMELSRRMGARARLKAGEVIMTPVHRQSQLFQLGVRAVAHVATVEPAGPGEGFRAAGPLKSSVVNMLTEIAAFRPEGGKRIRTVLTPLFASGDAGLPALVAASEMAAGLNAWLTTQTHHGAIESICFVAREEDTADDIRAALGMWGFTPQASERTPV